MNSDRGRIIRYCLMCITGGLICIICLCNFATQSYNTGKLLSPGESLFGGGFGGRDYYEIKNHSPVLTEIENTSSETFADTLEQRWFSFCFQYRLGILPEKPLGGGLEIGLHGEYPAQFAEDYGLPIVEFDSRLGLPPVYSKRFGYFHNLSIGWTVGAWIDNGWFLEYAGGIDGAHFNPYATFRILLVATDILTNELDFNDENILRQKDMGWNVRIAGGCAVDLPTIRFLPDKLIPEVCLIFPDYSKIKNIGLTYHLGIRWQYGI
ncbi:MAG: hypothetical protein GF401_04310 [Chitinivibrionales bacterium]|nr:hypothetical protein [Chitinivibrionales bacterium]